MRIGSGEGYTAEQIGPESKWSKLQSAPGLESFEMFCRTGPDLYQLPLKLKDHIGLGPKQSKTQTRIGGRRTEI